MVFKKKSEVKEEENKELNLGELVDSGRKYYPEDVNPILDAIRTLRRAILAGQIRCKRHPVNDISFGFVLSKEEVSNKNLRYGQNMHEYQRVHYASPLDELIFVDEATLKQEKIDSLKSKLTQAQHDQKLKVEEIEKLSKQLGELE